MTGRQMSRSRAGRVGLSRLVRARVARWFAWAAGALRCSVLRRRSPVRESIGGLDGTPLTQPIATKGKGTVKLTDTKVPLGVGSIAVECEDSTEGNVGSDDGRSDERDAIEMCCGEKGVKARRRWKL